MNDRNYLRSDRARTIYYARADTHTMRCTRYYDIDRDKLTRTILHALKSYLFAIYTCVCVCVCDVYKYYSVVATVQTI